MRLVITVPLDGTTGPAQLGELVREQVRSDLVQVAASIEEEIHELKPGQYGWTADPETHALRLHWAIREDMPS